MSLIQCDELCDFQEEGYCCLEIPTTVNSQNKNCPYFKKALFNNGNCFFQASNTYKL